MIKRKRKLPTKRLNHITAKASLPNCSKARFGVDSIHARVSHVRQSRMKRSRIMMESTNSAILSSNLGLVFYENTSGLSVLQRRVLKTSLQISAKSEDLSQLTETFNLINTVYPQLEETRFREICQSMNRGEKDCWRMLELEKKWIQWNKKNDLNYLFFLHYKISNPVEFALRLPALVMCHSPATCRPLLRTFLALTKTLRQNMLASSEFLSREYAKTDCSQWLSRKHNIHMQEVFGQKCSKLIITLIDLDTQYRIDREEFIRHSFVYGHVSHKNYTTKCCSTCFCQCKECHYEKFNYTSPFQTRGRHKDDLGFIQKRASLLESRSVLSRFLFDQFGVSL